MTPQNACIAILDQLGDLLHNLQEKDFIKPIDALSQSTIGQHLRHTLEFFICFENGFEKGIINYDKRSHDKLVENDKYIALSTIARIRQFISQSHDDKALLLEVGYHAESEVAVSIQTNYMRELVYNIEHAVHHMAIMKIGIRETAPYITLPADFGIAVSTIRHKEANSKITS